MENLTDVPTTSVTFVKFVTFVSTPARCPLPQFRQRARNTTRRVGGAIGPEILYPRTGGQHLQRKGGLDPVWRSQRTHAAKGF